MTPTNLTLILPLLDPVSLHACRQVSRLWKNILREDAYYLGRFEQLGVGISRELTIQHVKAFLPFIPAVEQPDNRFVSLTLRIYALFGRMNPDFVQSFKCGTKTCSRWHDTNALVFHIESDDEIEEICYIHPPFSEKGWHLKRHKKGTESAPEIEPITNELLQELATRTEIALFRRALTSQTL